MTAWENIASAMAKCTKRKLPNRHTRKGGYPYGSLFAFWVWLEVTRVNEEFDMLFGTF